MRVWNIVQTPEFQDWFDGSDKRLQEDILEHVELLRELGPELRRPYADTLRASVISNLKELRFNSRERVIRIFYVFDPNRNGVLLIGGNKSSSGDKKFYKTMIEQSEKIYLRYLGNRSKT
ncbi:MAG: type II toxin-antitoxin system RelE/ParE family toxin [Bacteriovoracia bacterium]